MTRHPVSKLSPGKRPAYQWYPGDFRRDTAVQACPFMARAIWREMLDFMHDGEPRGYLTAGGKPIGAAELARMIGGVTPRQVQAALAHLKDRNVYSVTDDGIIYSRRMVKDEGVIQARIEGGKNAAQPNAKEPPLPPPLPPPLDTPSASGNDRPSTPPPAFASAFASSRTPQKGPRWDDDGRMDALMSKWAESLWKYRKVHAVLTPNEKEKGHLIRLLSTYEDALLYEIVEEYCASDDERVRSKPPCLGMLAHFAPMIEEYLRRKGAA